MLAWSNGPTKSQAPIGIPSLPLTTQMIYSGTRLASAIFTKRYTYRGDVRDEPSRCHYCHQAPAFPIGHGRPEKLGEATEEGWNASRVPGKTSRETGLGKFL